MKVSGFTFIRNAILFDYPVVESIRSILPLCDEMVVAVGQSDDATYDLISRIDPNKIRIIETVWDDTMRAGGRVLALETDKAYRAVSGDSDWAFYIQGDEVLHEKYIEPVRQAMLQWKDDPRVDGLLFDYLHFYGSYDYVGASPKWYNHEIRIIRKSDAIYSFRDAQGFQKGKHQHLNVKPAHACMYHYGWVKEPIAMQRKQENFHKLYHPDDWVEKNVVKASEFDFSGIDALKRFNETHPAVMLDRIAKKNWQFDFDLSMSRMSLKNRAKILLKNALGIELGYKNYKLI